MRKCKHCGIKTGTISFPECSAGFVACDYVESRTLVMGDPHGALKAVEQVLERANFDFENEELIVLGDVADGWPEVAETLDFLIEKVKNLVFVRGNHDQWLKDWLKHQEMPRIWLQNGGSSSLRSYTKNPHLGTKHANFLNNTKFYHLDDEGRVFVHGGIQYGMPVETTDKMFVAWDRSALYEQNPVFPLYTEVFVGHTTTSQYDPELLPVHKGNVWFLDQGAGWEGKLTLMDVKTKEFWQSDMVWKLYPNEKGRNQQ